MNFFFFFGSFTLFFLQMAEFVDGLTDAELRTKLAEYGFPVVPITATTRKVMTKKLKLLIENKNKTNSEGRRWVS